MWGLGLFFSVQFTYQFGFLGLLCFAIPNAIGLFLFGLITDRVAKRSDDKESLAKFFDAWSKPFGIPLFLYQIAAISLTIFAVLRYLLLPLGLDPLFIYLPLGLLVVLAAAFLFGEEFGIRRIKWSHTALLGLAFVAILVILIGQKPNLFNSGRPFNGIPETFSAGTFIGYVIPICVGFLVGPWMDLQQWQRAIQIRREGRSITQAYAYGSILFFLLLLFHGSLTNWALMNGAGEYVRTGLLDMKYAHHSLTQFFHSQLETNPMLFTAYATFIGVCILTTLDSGYIALRWFFTNYMAKSQNMILTLLPAKFLTSPILAFLIAAVIGVGALIIPIRGISLPIKASDLGLELEYFMIFFATFFVAYSTLGMLRTMRGKTDLSLPQVKLFCIGALSVVIFSFGYLQDIPFFMTCGSLIPLGYIAWLFIKSQTEAEPREELVKTPAVAVATAGAAAVADDPTPAPAKQQQVDPATAAKIAEVDTYMTPEAIAAAQQIPDIVLNNDTPSGESATGYFEGKTFVHSFLSTYGDTNSVGNIYFGMYAMWVGKARELFLRKVLPEFDLDTTEYFILTRSFEHKFVREAKEFEKIRIEISVGEHNRKFVELNHKVLDGGNKILGKGKQTLMFVGSKDYSLLDIPVQIQTAFAYYAPTLAPTLRG